MKHNFKLLLTIGIAIVLAWSATKAVDPDFGWHYRLGEYILKHGIPKIDPFSYTMPSYPFVDYEWGSNVGIYLGQKYLGEYAMAVIWAIVVIITFWIAVPTKGGRYWWWALWLGVSVAATRFAVRPQVISWLFAAVVVRLMADEDLEKRWKWGFVPLMWVWANLHGSYFIGLGLWGMWWGIKMWRQKKIFWPEAGVGIMGAAVTLINPYGIRNWQEVLMQMSQTRLFAATLEEWRPFWEKPDLGMMAMIGWLVAIGWRCRKELMWEEVAVGLTALWAGLSSLRHGVLTMVILVPLSIKLWLVLGRDLGKLKNVSERWKVFETGAMIVTAGIIILELTLLVRYHSGGSGWKFPTEAVEYLQTAGYPKKLMANYGWGGYLIWKMPEERVFIDGRMSGWWWKGAEGESEHAFVEYLNVVWNPERYAQESLDKYGIKTVLWRRQAKTAGGILGRKIGEWGLQVDRGGQVFEQWLANHGWKKVYEDDMAVVYVSES
jgi:hypothetical protein